MKAFRYIILAIIVLNLPAASLKFGGDTIGGLLSYASFGMLLLYYFIEKKGKPNVWLILIGLSYYIISSFQYVGITKEFIFISIKF